MLRFACLIVAAALAFANPPSARADEWADPVVRLEVLDGGAGADGLHRAAIRLSLEPGWKTYWRAPGDAGIPPEFSWAGSQNMRSAQILWPTPEVFDQNGLRSVGYDRELVLPLEITPGQPGQAIRLRGRVELGVCREVCLPQTLSFDQRLDPATPRHPAIVAARSARPFTAREAGVRTVQCQVTPTAHGLAIEAHIRMPSAGGEEYTITESGDPQIWISQTDTRREGDTLIAAAELMHASARSFALDRSALRFTVLGRDHAVDIRGCSAG